MKFLHIEAIKEDRKRGIMINSDSDMKRFVRKSLPPQQWVFNPTYPTFPSGSFLSLDSASIFNFVITYAWDFPFA